MPSRQTEIPAWETHWIARNPAYRQDSKVWNLPGKSDRPRIMRDVAVLTPKAARQAVPPASPVLRSPLAELSQATRHLIIDGYERPLRRWALERCRRGLNALYFASGLLAAALAMWIAAILEGRGFVPSAPPVAIAMTLFPAAILLVYVFSCLGPILAAATYARRWLENMPDHR